MPNFFFDFETSWNYWYCCCCCCCGCCCCCWGWIFDNWTRTSGGTWLFKNSFSACNLPTSRVNSVCCLLISICCWLMVSSNLIIFSFLFKSLDMDGVNSCGQMSYGLKSHCNNSYGSNSKLELTSKVSCENHQILSRQGTLMYLKPNFFDFYGNRLWNSEG